MQKFKIKIVDTLKEQRIFIYLPEKIHEHHENWVPPIYSDERKFYDPKYNKSLLSSDTVLFLAYINGKPVGRIMGIINRKYNSLHNEKTARFFNFDCYNDPEVSYSLLDAAENWAVKKGMNKIIGPFGFSDKDPQGAQVEGFENIPVIATATNLPYLPRLIENSGYKKETDCLVYKLPIPSQIPDIYQRVFDRVTRNKHIRLREFTSRRQLKPYIVPVFRLVNETYRSLFGFDEMNEDEMHELARKYLPMLDPEFTKVITDQDNNPIAFVVASPNISKGIRKAKGKLFPLGFIHILSSAKHTDQLDLFLGAVKEKYMNTGLTALLGVSIFNSANKRGLKYIDSHLILESNKPMRAVMERLNAVIYKRYRVYSKLLIGV